MHQLVNKNTYITQSWRKGDRLGSVSSSNLLLGA